MKDKILRFARGDFSESQSNIVLSENQIILDAEEGRKCEGSIYMGNESGLPMKGLLYSECPHLSLNDKIFSGKEVEIRYTFSAENSHVGETAEGDIVIVSNCGEVRVPVNVSVVKPTIELGSIGKISDYSGFVALAKDKPDQALEVFADKDFAEVLLYRDNEKQLIYDTLIRDCSLRVAMEEFLVATKGKTRVILEVDRNSITYENCYAPFEDEIELQTSNWGGIKVDISSDSPFIKLEAYSVWTNDYPSGVIPVKYIIDADKMIEGTNLGRISIVTPNQDIEVRIRAIKHDTGDRTERFDRDLYVQVIHNYIELKKGKMTETDFIDKINKIYEKNKKKLSEGIASILQMYISAVIYKTEITDTMFSTIAGIKQPEEEADVIDVIEYAAACYIKAISAPIISRQQAMEKAAKEIRRLYENGCRHYILLWFLMNLEKRYENHRVLFYDLLEVIKDGCMNPIIYIEFCLVIRQCPELMHEWHESMIYPLVWGIDNHVFNKEMALAYTFHVSRIKEYNYVVYSSLDKLYDMYELDEILNAVCTMLIRAGKASPRYLKWYERGIEKQLRITGIYECYMQSLSGVPDASVPSSVMRYFMYDNRLAEREKQLLYAAVVQNKDKKTQIYKSYMLMISNFARKQLVAGHINDALAVLYEDSIKLPNIDETVAEALPKIMFRHKIVCSNDNMKAVSVSHKEFIGEQVETFINGVAYVDIYSDDYCLVLIDNDGNRHVGRDYYTVKKMLQLDYYAERCFELASDNEALLKYMYGRVEKDYQVTSLTIRVRQKARKKLALRSSYRKKNLSSLMQYYYDHAEGECLDELLGMEDFGETDRATREKWTQILIVRGLGSQAIDAVCRYGYDGIEDRFLVKLCDEAIEDCDSGKADSALLSMAYYIFSKGKITENIIKYLAAHYSGSSKSMYEIWKAAKGFGVDKSEIEEKLLAQLLFVEGDTSIGLNLLESYIENGVDKNLKKGYVSYLSYRYVLYDDAISKVVWEWIEHNILTEYNIICTLAVLKKLSKEENLTQAEKKFCDVKVCQMMQKGIIMPFFTNFSKYFKLPDELENKTLIMCVGRPGMNVHIRYKVQNSSIVTADMMEVFAGAYIREIVVFRGEKIVYECYEEKNNKKNVIKNGKLQYEYRQSKEISRYVMINKMLEHYEERNLDELYSCMETYIKLDEASHYLFETL